MNKKLLSLLNSFNLLNVFFKVSVPLISSDPTFNKETFGFSVGNKDLNSADPSSAKSTRFWSLHSMLAPRSKTTLTPYRFKVRIL